MTQDGLAATPDPAPVRSEGTMERRKQIMKFLIRHRHSGVFSGLAQDARLQEVTNDAATPAEFSRDLEALGHEAIGSMGCSIRHTAGTWSTRTPSISSMVSTRRRVRSHTGRGTTSSG